MPAGAKQVFEFGFVADMLPCELNPSPEAAWQAPYEVEVEQWLPHTYEQSAQPSATFAITVA